MINDLESLKLFFKKNLKNPVFGVGVYAFNRLGLEDIVPNYHLLALRYSLDTELIEKDIKVFALEKGMGTEHIKEPRNSTTILKHPRTKEYLKEITEEYGQPPVIIIYKSSTTIEKVCQDNLWILATPPTKFGKALFENKVRFRQILESLLIPVPPGEIVNVDDLNYEVLSQKYGSPFVIQHPTRGGGKGTFFISDINDFDNACFRLKNKPNDEGEFIEEKNNIDVIVDRFITGPSPSINGCVTKHGILSTNLQHQILDIPELYNSDKGSGLFCGHDWSSSSFSEKINQQAYQAVEAAGKYFQERGYKGIFGLDFVLDEKKEKLYVVEANPRLVASFPTLGMAQLMNNEPPILAFHLLEYLNLDYSLDVRKINSLMRQPKKGTHLFLHNLTKSWAQNQQVVRPGVYTLEGNGLKFLRPGYKLQHLKNEEEFIITEGVPIKKAHFSPNRRLCRILTLAPVLERYDKLNLWAERIVDITYKAFGMKPVHFVGIKRIFNPDFLAKG